MEQKTNWTNWALKNPEGRESNVVSYPGGKVIGLQVFEQAGYGIVNMTLTCRDSLADNHLEWSTRNRQGQIKSVGLKNSEYAHGMEVVEQDGHGVVDLRLLTNKGDSEFVTQNGNGSRTITIKAEPGQEVVGLQVREQAGFGIVDIRLLCRSRPD